MPSWKTFAAIAAGILSVACFTAAISTCARG